MITSGAGGDQRTNLLGKIGPYVAIGGFVREGAHEAREIDLDRAYAGEPFGQAVRAHLALVPIDEDRIDRDQAEPASHAARGEHGGLAQPDDRYVERAADLHQAGFLEVPDHERVIALAFDLQCSADRLRGAAKLGQRMEKAIRRIKPVHLELQAGSGHLCELPFKARDIGRLFGRVNKALIPEPRRRGICSHLSPPIDRSQ